MSKNVLVPIADGTEEMEAVIIIDILRRAGAIVIVASVDKLHVTASRGLTIKADRLIKECVNTPFDLVAVPGGMPGSEHLRDSKSLISILKQQHAEGRLFAAVCAAPAVVLQPHGLLAGYKATCHTSFAKYIPEQYYMDERVVVDRNCITSKGAGTTVDFALKLVEILFSRSAAESIAKAICA